MKIYQVFNFTHNRDGCFGHIWFFLLNIMTGVAATLVHCCMSADSTTPILIFTQSNSILIQTSEGSIRFNVNIHIIRLSFRRFSFLKIERRDPA